MGRDPNQDMPMVIQIKDEVRKLNTKEIIWSKIKNLEAKLDFEYNKQRFIGDQNIETNEELPENISNDNQSKKSSEESQSIKQEKKLSTRKIRTTSNESKTKETKQKKIKSTKESKETQENEKFGFLSRLVNDVENENKPQTTDTPSSDYQTPTKSKYSLQNSRDNFIDTIYEESQETF